MTTQAAGEGKQPGRHPSPAPTLTPEEWQYISILIGTDIRGDRKAGIRHVAEKHEDIWEKIQPACQWGWDELDDDS